MSHSALMGCLSIQKAPRAMGPSILNLNQHLAIGEDMMSLG